MNNEVTFFGAFREMWARIFDFSGVSGRKQFWFPFALHAIITLISSGLILASLMVEKYLKGEVKRADLEKRMREGNTMVNVRTR